MIVNNGLALKNLQDHSFLFQTFDKGGLTNRESFGPKGEKCLHFSGQVYLRNSFMGIALAVIPNFRYFGQSLFVVTFINNGSKNCK